MIKLLLLCEQIFSLHGSVRWSPRCSGLSECVCGLLGGNILYSHRRHGSVVLQNTLAVERAWTKRDHAHLLVLSLTNSKAPWANLEFSDLLSFLHTESLVVVLWVKSDQSTTSLNHWRRVSVCFVCVHVCFKQRLYCWDASSSTDPASPRASKLWKHTGRLLVLNG